MIVIIILLHNIMPYSLEACAAHAPYLLHAVAPQTCGASKRASIDTTDNCRSDISAASACCCTFSSYKCHFHSYDALANATTYGSILRIVDACQNKLQ